jgi:dTDP-4-amino-4,6-dideoxygalactose transaminase
VEAFEQEFAERVGIGHAVALASGTAAIHLALRIIGVMPQDEVFASTLTFVGSVSPIVFFGATPVFIDCDRISWNMDPHLLSEELSRAASMSRLPKAVVPTDIYGQCADYDNIFSICSEYGVPIILDSAEAVGATYKGKSAGTGAHAAVFSFNGNKIITTSGGGMLVSDDKDFIEKASFLSQQAREPLPHYEHTEPGYNYRMSNVLAAIGRGQLRVLDERVRRKREIFQTYHKGLSDIPGITFMPEAAYGVCTRWLTVILVDPKEFGADREVIRLALEAHNIESRPIWKPMHMQPVFCTSGSGANNGKRQYASRAVGGRVSESLFEGGLCLPSGTAMSREDQDRVISVIAGCKR